MRESRIMTGRLGVLGLACLLYLVWAGAGQAQTRTEAADRAQTGLARIDSLLAAGEPAAAVREARRLHGSLGDDPLYGWQIEGRLGLALLRSGDPEGALPYLESTMRHDPRDPVAHRNIAAALRDLGMRGRALSEFRLVVELAPRDFAARLEFGQFLAEFRDFKGARRELEIARSLCPDCPEADPALAGVLLEAGEFDAAAEPLERLMVRDPTPWARRNLGLALAGAGRYRELLDFLDGLAPEGLTAAETNLWVETEGRLEESRRSRACLAALADPQAVPGGLAEELLTDHGFWGRVSLNLLEAGHFAEGLEAADRAIALDPDNVVYRNNRVVLLLKLGRDGEAEREWQDVLRLDPSLEKKEAE